MSEHFDITDLSMDFDPNDPTIVRWVVNLIRARLRDAEGRIEELEGKVAEIVRRHDFEDSYAAEQGERS